MATLGDPLLDLGTAMGYWVEASDPRVFRSLGLGTTALRGNDTREVVWARYFEKTRKRLVPMTRCRVFRLFKISVIAQQIFARNMSRTSVDARSVRLGDAVRVLGSFGVKESRRAT